MFKRKVFIGLLLLLVVLAAGCQTVEPQTVEVPVEVEVTRIVEVPVEAEPVAEQTAPDLFPTLQTEVVNYHSEVTGRDYTVYVALPLSYEMVEHTYPTVYVTDGDWYTLPTAMIAGQLAFGSDEVPETIIVGIGYGGSAMEQFELREADMDGDNKELFLQFMQEELIPDIEAHYRADPTQRAIMGHSLGGEFSIYAMYNAPETFQKMIASSPGGSYPLSLNNVYGNEIDALPVRLYATLGELEVDYLADFEKFSAALQASDYDDLSAELQVLDGEHHMSIWPRTFTNGLRYVFADWDGTYRLEA